MKPNPYDTASPAEKALVGLLTMLVNSRPDVGRALAVSKQGVAAIHAVSHLLMHLTAEQQAMLKVPQITDDEAAQMVHATLMEMWEAADKVRELEKTLAEREALMAEYRRRLERIAFIPGF